MATIDFQKAIGWRIPWHAELHPRDRFGRFRDDADVGEANPGHAPAHASHASSPGYHKIAREITRYFETKGAIKPGAEITKWAPVDGVARNGQGKPGRAHNKVFLVDTWLSNGTYAGRVRVRARRTRSAVRWEFGNIGTPAVNSPRIPRDTHGNIQRVPGGPGRGPVGNLRNFRVMGNVKLHEVQQQIHAQGFGHPEHPDPVALQAVNEEVRRRDRQGRLEAQQAADQGLAGWKDMNRLNIRLKNAAAKIVPHPQGFRNLEQGSDRQVHFEVKDQGGGIHRLQGMQNDQHVWELERASNLSPPDNGPSIRAQYEHMNAYAAARDRGAGRRTAEHEADQALQATPTPQVQPVSAWVKWFPRPNISPGAMPVNERERAHYANLLGNHIPRGAQIVGVHEEGHRLDVYIHNQNGALRKKRFHLSGQAPFMPGAPTGASPVHEGNTLPPTPPVRGDGQPALGHDVAGNSLKVGDKVGRVGNQAWRGVVVGDGEGKVQVDWGNGNVNLIPPSVLQYRGTGGDATVQPGVRRFAAHIPTRPPQARVTNPGEARVSNPDPLQPENHKDKAIFRRPVGHRGDEIRAEVPGAVGWRWLGQPYGWVEIVDNKGKRWEAYWQGNLGDGRPPLIKKTPGIANRAPIGAQVRGGQRRSGKVVAHLHGGKVAVLTEGGHRREWQARNVKVISGGAAARPAAAAMPVPSSAKSRQVRQQDRTKRMIRALREGGYLQRNETIIGWEPRQGGIGQGPPRSGGRTRRVYIGKLGDHVATRVVDFRFGQKGGGTKAYRAELLGEHKSAIPEHPASPLNAGPKPTLPQTPHIPQAPRKPGDVPPAPANYEPVDLPDWLQNGAIKPGRVIEAANINKTGFGKIGDRAVFLKQLRPGMLGKPPEAPREAAANYLAKRIGVRTPRVAQRSDIVVGADGQPKTGVVMDLVPADPNKPAGPHNVAPAAITGEAKYAPRGYDRVDVNRMGLFDAVIAQTDRHHRNWLVDKKGRPWAIDNGFSMQLTNGGEWGNGSKFIGAINKKPLPPEQLNTLREMEESRATITADLKGLGMEDEAIQAMWARVAFMSRNGMIDGDKMNLNVGSPVKIRN